MNLKATLQQLLDLEAADSGSDSRAFKLGYLLSFVTSPGCSTHAEMQDAAEKRIARLEAKNTTK